MERTTRVRLSRCSCPSEKTACWQGSSLDAPQRSCLASQQDYTLASC
ncbi:MAG: hypothetical protein M0Q13_02860 [Methanothrix sp.]|nr:hypothetical protein [Methanothrix sp.]